LAVALMALGSACAKSNSPQPGRETNWLSVCVLDTDCERSDCVCGLCSFECSSDDECGAELRCQQSDTALVRAACGTQVSAIAGMCSPECTTESDCAQGQGCVQGACAPALDGSVPGLDAAFVDAGMSDAGP
jgi:hypothetical protein